MKNSTSVKGKKRFMVPQKAMRLVVAKAVVLSEHCWSRAFLAQ